MLSSSLNIEKTILYYNSDNNNNSNSNGDNNSSDANSNEILYAEEHRDKTEDKKLSNRHMVYLLKELLGYDLTTTSTIEFGGSLVILTKPTVVLNEYNNTVGFFEETLQNIVGSFKSIPERDKNTVVVIPFGEITQYNQHYVTIVAILKHKTVKIYVIDPKPMSFNNQNDEIREIFGKSYTLIDFKRIYLYQQSIFDSVTCGYFCFKTIQSLVGNNNFQMYSIVDTWNSEVVYDILFFGNTKPNILNKASSIFVTSKSWLKPETTEQIKNVLSNLQ